MAAARQSENPSTSPGHNAVAAIRGVPAAAVGNDGIVRDVIRDRQGVHSLYRSVDLPGVANLRL
jgi:hypothetical protein